MEVKEDREYSFFVHKSKWKPKSGVGKMRIRFKIYFNRNFLNENDISCKQEFFKINGIPFMGELCYKKRYFEKGKYKKGKNSAVVELLLPKKVCDLLELNDMQRVKLRLNR